MTDIAIVGIGAIFPGAGDASTFWNNIRSGVDAITEVPADRWDPEVYYRPGEDGADRFYCRRGGFIDDLAEFDPAQFGIMPAAVPGTEPDQLLMLRAAAEAIADGGGLPDRERAGVIIGRGGYLTPGLARIDQQVHTAHQLAALLRDLVPELAPARLDAIRDAFTRQAGPQSSDPPIGLVPNFAASRLANRFDLRGPAYTVDAACASSLLAVDHAVRELTAGRCDAVLAGGVHTCHHPTLWSVFTQLRALSAGGRIRPFDSRADGTLLSEGAGLVLLRRLDDAMASGCRIYAVIRGVGVSSDGRATSMMNPLAEGQELAIRRAWAAAGLDPAAPDALGLLEAHGTGTLVGDEVEVAALERVFGPRGSGGVIGLGTVKSMIGHAMPAAGIAGLIKAALAVYHGVMPPTLNISEPLPALARSRFEPVRQARPWPGNGVRRAAVSAFGFGGINAHLVIEALPAGGRKARLSQPAQALGGPGARAAGSAPSVLRLSAGSPREMARLLDAPEADLLGRADAEPGAGPCRLAIAAPDSRAIAVARKVVARAAPWRGRGDIWFSPAPLLSAQEQVAFLFPGFEPAFAPAAVSGVAEHFGLPALRLRGDGVDAGPDGGIEAFAMDVFAVSRIMVGALRELGITPGVLAGHSLGEWIAMVFAGMYPGIDDFIASVQPDMAKVPDLVYAALGASAGQARQLIGPGIVVTHDNCPHQSVVCGPPSPVADLVERARRAGILAQVLPFHTGFHSPMFEPFLGPAREMLERLEISPARIPVWSATSLSPFPAGPRQVRELVLRHLVEPVRFRQLVQLLHDSGARAFVQVGMGSLTGFVDDTLAGRDHLTVAAAAPGRDGLGQLARVAAALWANGLSPRFERLRTSSRAGVRLRLGAPLARLPGLALTDAGQTITAVPPAARPEIALAPAGLPAGTPVLAELAALMAETTAAAGAVARSLASRPGPPASLAGPPEQGPRQGGLRQDGPRELTTAREFSLRTMPEIADHCLVTQPQDWPDDSDRFPVVPMTALLDVFAQAARELIPGCVVTGFERVTAARWLTVAPPTTAPVRASSDGAGRVRVRIEGYASGTVVVSDGYPPAPAPTSARLRGERPAPVAASELYTGGWMFHGPRFAGVAGVASVADDGIAGTLLSMPTPGALLDSAGQLIGHWMQVATTADQNVLPTGIGAVRLFGPQPPAGERLAAVSWIRELTGVAMRADAELRTGDGRVWCRIEDWTTRRFATNQAIWQVKLHAERSTLSQRYPGGWSAVWECWTDTASRELIMRRYLNAAERRVYEALNPLQQRQWLLRVIAAKDAVRSLLWERGAGPLFPAEVTVTEAGDGLRVRGPFRAPAVSVAYRRAGGNARACAVAIAAGEPVDFTIDLSDDGSLLVARSTDAPRPISSLALAAAP